MLKLKFKDNRKEPFWVMEKSFSIGTADRNHLTINDRSMSDQHAKIIIKDDGFLLKDVGSVNGTYVNSQRITQKHISCGDVIAFGDVELEVVDPLIEMGDDEAGYWSLIADSSWLSGQEFPLSFADSKVVTVGRGTQSDLVFPGTHLSRSHAEIELKGHSIIVRDLGSANGTFINDEKITEAKVYPGDRIRFDVYSFKVFGPGIALSSAATSSFRAVTEDMLERTDSNKQWKSKPTSPGNREEVNLYEKNKASIILASSVLVAVVAAAVYVGVSFLG